MTITIGVRSYRGIQAADLACDPIGLVCGVNASGKSSISQAVAACLTGSAIAARFGLTAGKADQLVRRGAKEGVAKLTGPNGEARISWPECKLATTGASPPHASEYAFVMPGAPSVASMAPKDRAAVLNTYLKAEPTKEDLADAMAERFTPESIGKLWDEIQDKGWDATAAAYEVARRDAGRDWGSATGVRFGSDKARNWRPDGWGELLDNFTVADLDGQISELQTDLENVIAGQAVDEAQLATWREAAGNVEQLQEAAAEATAAYEAAAKALIDARADRQALPSPVGTASGVPCPHCEGLVLVSVTARATVLSKFVAPDEAENKKRQLAIADADGTLSRLTSEEQAASRAVGAAGAALTAALDARNRIAGMGEKKGAAGLVTRAREALDGRKRDLDMRKQVDQAAVHYRTWMSSDLKLALLAPAGLRAQKLGQAVGLFNTSVLAPLCETAGWAPVNLTEELTVRFGERPFALLSDGEQYRVRTTLAIAMAVLDGSDMVILDGADMLDSPGRSGALRALVESGLDALICMTSVRGASVPDLAKAGLGGTWVLDEATAAPLDAQAAA